MYYVMDIAVGGGEEGCKLYCKRCVLSLQEVRSQPQNMVMDMVFEEPWTKQLIEELAPHGYVRVAGERLQVCMGVHFCMSVGCCIVVGCCRIVGCSKSVGYCMGMGCCMGVWAAVWVCGLLYGCVGCCIGVSCCMGVYSAT